MRLHCCAFGVLIAVGFAFDGLPGERVEQAADVRLTLSFQTVWGGDYNWCTTSAEIVHGRGGISYRCGGAGPFGTASPAPGARVWRRTLDDSETATLHKLYEAAHLFEGGHIGADYSGSDLPFYILIVRSDQAVVLVATGNPTFSRGSPRGALFDWLLRETQALTR